MYFGDVACEQSHATTHIGQILLGVSHTQLDSAHTSALLTARHMTHRRSTLVSAFELKLKHKHQTDLCATSIVDDETKTMHATQQYKVHNNITRTMWKRLNIAIILHCKQLLSITRFHLIEIHLLSVDLSLLSSNKVTLLLFPPFDGFVALPKSSSCCRPLASRASFEERDVTYLDLYL
jgi:hypothetical protein